MIGEMLLGILIFVGIGLVGFAIVWLFDNDVASMFVAIGMSLTWGCVGLELSGNISGGFLSILGASAVTGILGFLIWKVCDRFNFNSRIAPVCVFVILIGSFVGFWHMHLRNTEQGPYSRNIVSIEEPVITETKYEILGGSDTTRISGSITGVRYIRGSVNEGDYYKIYYAKQDKNGETIAVPITISEKATTVVLMPETEAGPEYLLVTVKKYYKENRDVEPAELILDKTVYTYRLYVHEDTFNGIKLDGD